MEWVVLIIIVAIFISIFVSVRKWGSQRKKLQLQLERASDPNKMANGGVATSHKKIKQNYTEDICDTLR